jgi:hypothetical protein
LFLILIYVLILAQRHYLDVQVLERQPTKPWLWGLQQLQLSCEDPEQAKAWVAALNKELTLQEHR